MVEVKKKTTKARKKIWFQIVAPKFFKEDVLGETTAYEQKDLIGKILKINLMALSNDIKKQNINITFKITSVQGNNALTEIIGYEIIPASVRRFAGKSKKRIDMSFVCEIQNKINVRIKPILLIKITTKGSVTSILRSETVKFLGSNVKKMTYEELINSIITRKLQSSLRDALKKIYPVRVCEIRKLSIEKKAPANEGAEENEIQTKESEENIEKKEQVKEEQEIKGVPTSKSSDFEEQKEKEATKETEDIKKEVATKTEIKSSS